MRRKFPLSEHHNCFRVVSNLDKAKDTLEKEIVSDDIIVSVNNKATPLIVFVQDKLVAVYNFPTNVHDDDVDEINEVKAVQLVKSQLPSLGAPKCPR